MKKLTKTNIRNVWFAKKCFQNLWNSKKKNRERSKIQVEDYKYRKNSHKKRTYYRNFFIQDSIEPEISLLYFCGHKNAKVYLESKVDQFFENHQVAGFTRFFKRGGWRGGVNCLRGVLKTFSAQTKSFVWN